MNNYSSFVTHISRKEGGEWEQVNAESQIKTERDINLLSYGNGEKYIAFKFSNGRTWDSIIGWRDAHPLDASKPDKTVFAEAEKIIYGDREQTYGHPAKNLKNIAWQWTEYMRAKYGSSLQLSEEDVCWMMVDLKKCRQMNSAKRDNLVDAIGYIGLIERCE